MSDNLITESDIFKYTLADHEDLTDAKSLENLGYLVDRIPSNIFRDEYSIIFQAMRWSNKNKMPLTRVVLQELMINSATEIIDSDKVELHRNINDEVERYDEIEADTLTVYDLLMYEDVTDDRMQGQTNLYLESWYEDEMNQLVYDMSQIMTTGLRVGNKTYRGAEDGNVYYRKKYELLESIVNERKDYLADDIITSDMTSSEMQERITEEESTTEVVTYMGIPSLDDELMGLRKGEYMVVQAGSGVGKTRFSSGSVGYEALKNGKNVLHISLEQKPTRILPMYVARHIVEKEGTLPDLDDRGILRRTYSPQYESIVQEAYYDLSSESEELGNLAIIGRDLQASEFEDYLNTIYDKFKFDVLILDYFGLVGTEVRTMYQEYRQVASYIKSACKNFRGVGFLGVVVNQLREETEKAMIAGDVSASKLGGSDSQELLKGSDILLTLYESEEMKEEQQMKLLVDKLRLGSVPDIDIDVDKGRSFFMEREEEEEAFI